MSPMVPAAMRAARAMWSGVHQDGAGWAVYVVQVASHHPGNGPGGQPRARMLSMAALPALACDGVRGGPFSRLAAALELPARWHGVQQDAGDDERRHHGHDEQRDPA